MTEPVAVGDAVAAQIRRFRTARKWSVRKLADECARLGMPSLTESSLSNIERGQAEGAKRTRRRVLLEELVVLARALGVPPILLVYPLGSTGLVEVLPGQSAPTWDSLKWYIGTGPFPGENRIGWVNDDVMAIELFRMHEGHILDWYFERDRPLVDPERADEEIEAHERKLADAKQNVVSLRREMRKRWGLAPPALPRELAEEIGEPNFVVYERAGALGRIQERRTVDAGSAEDHYLAAMRPEWHWVDLPFKERPRDFNRDEEGDQDG